MILICTNEVAGATGYHKSVVELANGLHRDGYPVSMLAFLNSSDGSDRMLPLWPLDGGIAVFALQTLAADGGRLLHRNFHPALSVELGASRFGFTENQLAALRQINDALTEEDTILFTAPTPAYVFHRALDGTAHNAKTVLQIHNDYRFHEGLWNLLMDTRDSIDRLQTVADGQRAQFVPTFDDSDVSFIPNFPGQDGQGVELVEHEGVTIALPASFQDRKNQLDAVRALALIEDESVHLTLWGAINRRNPYFVAVRRLVGELGLAGRVHFPGFGTESAIYSTADIVLMTSRSEGLPYPLIEAGFHSLPAVAYDFEFGPRDAIEDGGSGFIVPLGDVEQLAQRLAELASDVGLRARFGARARELFDERFSVAAVLERYRRFLGPPGGLTDLAEVFATDGVEPVARDAVSHRLRQSGARNLHRVTVTSRVGLHDVQVDDGERVETPTVHRAGETTRIEFSAERDEVISYVTVPGSQDRHYLANTKGIELEVLPYLRRDANYGDGTPPVIDTIHAASGGLRPLTPRDRTAIAKTIVKRASRDIAWKLRQLAACGKPMKQSPTEPHSQPARSSAPRQDAQSAATSPTSSTPSKAAGSPRQEDESGGATTSTKATATLGAIGRMAAEYRTAAEEMGLKVAVGTSAPTRREIPRHPWYPVVSGVDSFGSPINQPGGVTVRNEGSTRRPAVRIAGEYDWLLLRDAARERRIAPPFGYGEFFERICAAEREHGLFDITTRDGIHVWELGRVALILQFAEALGMWGKDNAIGVPVKDVYVGSKRLTAAPPARRVVFDYARRGQSGYRTAAYRDNETMFVVQPSPEGYPEVDDTNLLYPLHEFSRWRQDSRRRAAQLRVPEVDARPFEEALGDALGMQVDLGTHLRNRLLTFLDQRDFFTPVFERVQPEEVLVASSHWWAGVNVAARRAGALVSDIQYADTGRYHPTFWFGGVPHYGATRFYAWSEYWAARTNVYQEHVIVPRQQPEFTVAERRDVSEQIWDVCVISQPRVLRRILAFVKELVDARPDLKVVIAPHPSQRPFMSEELAGVGLTDRVTLSSDDTLTTVQQAAVCVGGYSTSLWEAASLGRPVYVIPVPGHELTLSDIEAGLFRLATSPHDLVPYEVPDSRRSIFGTV